MSEELATRTAEGIEAVVAAIQILGLVISLNGAVIFIALMRAKK